MERKPNNNKKVETAKLGPSEFQKGLNKLGDNATLEDLENLHNNKNETVINNDGGVFEVEKEKNIITKKEEKNESGLGSDKKETQANLEIKESLEKTNKAKAEIKEKTQKIDELKDKYSEKGFFGKIFKRSEKKDAKEFQEDINKLEKERMQIALDRIDKQLQDKNISEKRKEQLEKRRLKVAEAAVNVLTDQEKKNNERSFEGAGHTLLSKVDKITPNWWKNQPRVTKMAITTGIVSMVIPGGFVANFASRMMGGVVGMGAGMAVGKATEWGFNKYIDRKKSKQEKEASIDTFQKDAEALFELLLKNKKSLSKAESAKLKTSAGLTIVATILTSMEARGQVGEQLFDQNVGHEGSYALDYLKNIGKSAENLMNKFGIDFSDVKENDFQINTGEKGMSSEQVYKMSADSKPADFDYSKETTGPIGAEINTESIVQDSVNVEKNTILHTVGKNEFLNSVLRDEKFLESIGAKGLSAHETDNLVANLAKRIENSAGFEDLKSLKEGGTVDLNNLRQLVEQDIEIGGKTFGSLVERADALDASTTAEGVPVSELSETYSEATGEAHTSAISSEAHAASGNEMLNYGEVKQNLWNSLNEKFPNGQYSVQSSDSTWSIVKEKLLKDALSLDEGPNALSDDKINNLTANILNKLRTEIRTGNLSTKEWGCNMAQIKAGDTLNMKKLLELAENTKLNINGQTMNLIERASVYEVPERLAGGFDTDWENCGGKPCGERIVRHVEKPTEKVVSHKAVSHVHNTQHPIHRTATYTPPEQQEFTKAELKAMDPSYNPDVTYKEDWRRVVSQQTTENSGVGRSGNLFDSRDAARKFRSNNMGLWSDYKVEKDPQTGKYYLAQKSGESHGGHSSSGSKGSSGGGRSDSRGGQSGGSSESKSSSRGSRSDSRGGQSL